jgi:magnesium and cobalt transporter
MIENRVEERSWLDRLTHFISGEPQTKSDLEDVLSLAEEHEIIDQDARKIMEGALLVTNMQVRDIMIPRAQMIVIDSDESVQEALPKIIDAGHSRFPVIGEGMDDVIGFYSLRICYRWLRARARRPHCVN